MCNSPISDYERAEKLRKVLRQQNEEICQILGKVLGYPWYVDSKEVHPKATLETGVRVGDHVAVSIAAEAAKEILKLKEEHDVLLAIINNMALLLKHNQDNPNETKTLLS